MKSAKHWLFGAVMVVLLAACSHYPSGDADPNLSKTQLSQPTKQTLAAPQTENPEIESADAADDPTETQDSDEVTPTETVLTAETNIPEATDYVCDDPFAGESVRFPTDYWNTNFCLHSIPYAEIFSGGPPPDGIPPIDNPKFVSVFDADDWIEDREPVIIFQEGDDVRAYPLQIMTWHEIVNDSLDGRPVVVTFCPLCNTALVFERPIVDGKLLTFGTSGNLRNSDLVMYDRQTESWWQQFSGEAIVGDLTGMKLEFLPTAIISWADYKTQHPDGQVLSRDTGFSRRYGSNPYVGYDDVNQSPFLFSGVSDDRLRPMARVLGILLPEGGRIAYTFERLREEQVINDILDGTPIVVFWKSGTASALDTSSISSGRDVGSTGVFLSTFQGQTLTFLHNEDDTFQDEQTDSTWNLTGLAESGAFEGAQLTPVPHHDTFWFAWAAFVPPDSLSGD